MNLKIIIGFGLIISFLLITGCGSSKNLNNYIYLEPEGSLSNNQLEDSRDIIQTKLDVYGYSSTKTYIENGLIIIKTDNKLIENINFLDEIIISAPIFQTKIGQETVFKGGKDITYVCRTAQCSGIDECNQITEGNWSCRFGFSISLKSEAAERKARITDKLSIVTIDDQGNAVRRDNQYLSEKLQIYLDDYLIDELKIGSSLKGRVVSDIKISGSGQGNNYQEAVSSALENMRNLQIILITESLPVKFKVVKIIKKEI
jgi:hypothetical protein